MTNFIVKFFPLIILLIVGISYFLAINWGLKENISIEVYRTCIEPEKIKYNSDILITERGVCLRQRICNEFDILDCEKTDEKIKNNLNWKIAKDLNKNNFDFKTIKDNEDRMNRVDNEIIELSVGGVFINYAVNEWQAACIKCRYVVGNVDPETFKYLGGKYSKDKNKVYYKNEIIGADQETFIYEKGGGKAIGKGRDKDGTWIKGVLQER